MSTNRASALDGIRGVALACPIVVHLGIVGADRGLWLAIGMFFTLSAFLVTTLALREMDSTGSLKLGKFWIRRLRRLLPASLLVLGLIVIVAWQLDWPGLAAVKGDVMSALVWGANWEQLNGGGYWDSFSPSLTHHFWSLSFEEQVYVFFPLVMLGLVLLRRRLRVGDVTDYVAGASIVILAASWWFLWTVDDATSLYLNTVSRLGEIALGMLAASLNHKYRETRLSTRAATVITTLGIVAAAPMWIWSAGDTVGGVRYGITLASPLSALVVAMLWRYPESLPSRFFALRVPAWLGRRSYGVYLLHLPIIDFLSFKLGHEHLPRPWMVVAVAATIVGAGVMFRWFEEPLRVGEWVRSNRMVIFGLATFMVVVAATTLAVVRGEQPLLAIPPSVGPPPTSSTTTTNAPTDTLVVPSTGEITTPPAPVTEAPLVNRTALVVGDSTAWVTAGAVDRSLAPLGYTTSEVHMVGCPLGGDARVKTSVMGGEVKVRELGEEPGCDLWWNEYLPQWLDAVQPGVVTIVGGYGLAWDADPAGDDHWCHLGDGSGLCESWAKARIEATTDLIRAHAPDTTVVWMTVGHVDPWGPLDIAPEAIDALNVLIRAEAARSGSLLVDLGTWLDTHLDLTVDGTHLGIEGVEALVPWFDVNLAPIVPR